VRSVAGGFGPARCDSGRPGSESTRRPRRLVIEAATRL